MKPGQCPIPEMIPPCAKSCFHDGQCPATQKCCPTMGGFACSEPRGPGSGQGPVKRPGARASEAAVARAREAVKGVVGDVVKEMFCNMVIEMVMGILHYTYWRSFQSSALFIWHVC
ncbi:WAP four-disulfide core domain protein 2-like [Sinocyclocheilus rhinocerous]|uniref:WAP four-disulfide core domain protein 2-like n=1 Tax=Sinocyclocheilus rhinocerous TaxID=307959 RepID=UPI0007BA5B51|nr:PREDICTED: WAP four-disulfide core domain protein 2-like [Sinocyclocheilus rhinocerous]